MRRSILLFTALAAAGSAAAASRAPGPLAPPFALDTVVIEAPQPDATRTYWVYELKDRPAVEALAKGSGLPLRFVWDANQSRILQGVYTQRWPVVIGPGSVIAQAVRAGYTPLASAPSFGQGAVFVVRKDSPVQSITHETAHTLRLATLPTDTVANFLGRGQLRGAGVSVDDFKSLETYPNNGSAIFSLVLDRADVAMIGRLQYEKLAANLHLGGRPVASMLRELPARGAMTMPGIGVAIAPSVTPEEAAALRKALTVPNPDPALVKARWGGMQSASEAQYAAIIHLVYTVPRVLPGATVVDAAFVAKALRDRSALVVDDRVASEYADGHIPGAVSIPYGEHSEPVIGFDASRDTFGLLARDPDKARPVVFACNGPECWKSYKGATFALKHGYQHVYWFRGGFPAWEKAGYPTSREEADAS